MDAGTWLRIRFCAYKTVQDLQKGEGMTEMKELNEKEPDAVPDGFRRQQGGMTVKENTDDRNTALDEEVLERVTGGLGGPFVPGAQQGPGPSPASRTGGIPAPSSSVPTASFDMACWKSDTMAHVFVENGRGEEVCIYCGAARPRLT